MKLIVALAVLCAIACSIEAQRIHRLNASDFQLPNVRQSTGPVYDRPASVSSRSNSEKIFFFSVILIVGCFFLFLQNQRFRRAGAYKRPLSQRREEDKNNQHNHEVHITEEEVAYYNRLFHHRNTEVKAMGGIEHNFWWKYRRPHLQARSAAAWKIMNLIHFLQMDGSIY